MKWSWRIGKLAGIDVRIHVTFLLLMAWVAASGKMGGVGFLLALFGCVVLHELGHALAARRFGIPTRDITLLPIGGVARLEGMPEKPAQELVVAIAGPAVNVAIAAALSVGMAAVGSGPFLERLLIANVWLVAFNLIPAFPMDGGRVLRALLASRMQYVRATEIAATVGRTLAVGLGFAGLFLTPMLLFIAMFVWMGATQEAAAVRMKAAMAAMPRWPLMPAHPLVWRSRPVMVPVKVIRLG